MQQRRRHVLTLLVSAAVVVACGGGGDGADVLRTYEVELHVDDSSDDYRYIATGEVPDFTVGDEVTFHLVNTGQFNHDLQVVAPDGDVVGVAGTVPPGGELDLIVYLGQTGYYRLNCLFDNHLTEHHMQTLIEVQPQQV